MTGTEEQAVEAAQRALGAEHAGLYAYGVAGGVVGPTSAEGVRALDGYAAHRTRRDLLEDVVRALGGEPVAASAGYALPEPVNGTASASRLAVRVEDRCAASYADLVAASTGELRRAAAGWLTNAATRGLSWGAAPTAFPGLAPPR